MDTVLGTIGHNFCRLVGYEEGKKVWGCESPQGGYDLSDIFLPFSFSFFLFFLVAYLNV